MPAKSKKKNKGKGLVSSLLGELLSISLNFLGGLIVGLTAPVIAVAGIVGGVYLFTKKVPFVSQVDTDDTTGERSLRLELMAPGEAKAALEARQSELKEAWTEFREELDKVMRQASEESTSSENADAESQP